MYICVLNYVLIHGEVSIISMMCVCHLVVISKTTFTMIQNDFKQLIHDFWFI